MTTKSNRKKRLRLIVKGQVQGVGFRPFIWKLAHSLNLTGFCGNTSEGVLIEIQGTGLEDFCARLGADPPPLARITDICREFLPLKKGEKDFSIEASSKTPSKDILTAPDMAVCQDCLNEMRDPNNARYGYPFINCVNCGPRFSITASLPYDRPNTVMACFPMCDHCRQEYEDPTDRRFHAQPIACEKCGPKIWLVTGQPDDNARKTPENTRNALANAARLLVNGKILAVKGLGGFQLACDARNDETVLRLRKLKKRPSKAFAVMTDGINSALRFATLTDLQKKLLEGREKPITLCRKADSAQAPLAANIAPDSLFIGVMLPYTPLHHLLFEELKKLGTQFPALVMTSGNPAGEPICLGNREAIAKLGHMADAWLLHDRDILVRVDDSVIFTSDNPLADDSCQADALLPETPFLLRRARGYVPGKIDLPSGPDIAVLGAGAELKNVFCLTRKNEAFPGQHIGDLSTPATLDFYQSALKHMQNLLEVECGLVVHDLHPDFLSTQFARELAQTKNIPRVALQHHAAHAAALLCENACLQSALIIALDGTGLGEDNGIQGGEFIYMRPAEAAWRRVGSFQQFRLPGGDAATKRPWRIARSLIRDYAIPASATTKHEARMLDEMLAKKINSPLTSSCGRLFDGVSAILGLCHEASYEGQAPMRLETAARQWLSNHEAKTLPELVPDIGVDALPRLNVVSLAQGIHQLATAGANINMLAAAFHHNLAQGISNLAVRLAREHETNIIGLTGGVMANSLLLSLLWQRLAARGYRPLLHKALPPGDACVSLGQAFWGRLLLAKGKI